MVAKRASRRAVFSLAHPGGVFLTNSLPTVRRVAEVRFVWMLESPVATGIGSAPHEARYGSHGGDMPNKTVLIAS